MHLMSATSVGRDALAATCRELSLTCSPRQGCDDTVVLVRKMTRDIVQAYFKKTEQGAQQTRRVTRREHTSMRLMP